MMVTKRYQKNWIIDAIILVVFLMELFINFTGVTIHEWLDISVVGLVLLHLITHWNWVKAVTSRFFGAGTNRSRLFYVLDAGIAGGFLMILITGQMISTWFNLAMDIYLVWRDLHIIVSILTLVILAFKLILHWRWITNTTHEVVCSIISLITGIQAVIRTRSLPDRRQFITTLCITEVAALFSLRNSTKILLESAGP